MSNTKRLTTKNIQAINLYLTDPGQDGGAAWREIYSGKNKPASSASFSRLIKSEEGQAYLEERMAVISANLASSSDAISAIEDAYAPAQERVLKEISRIGLYNPKDLYHSDGSIKHLTEMSDDIAACISSLEVDEIRDGGGKVIGTKTKIRFWSKDSSLDKLGRYHKMFTDKLEVVGLSHEEALNELED